MSIKLVGSKVARQCVVRLIGGGRENQRWDFLPGFDTKVVLNVILGVKITLFEVMVLG